MKNKLKAISIAACCLVASLWSEAQSMDNQPDILESVTMNRIANILSSSQNEFDNEIDALDLVSTSSQNINLQDSETSWASYLLSPVKSSMQVANEFTKLAISNPKFAMVVGMAYLIPAASAACKCYCYWWDPKPHCDYIGYSVGSPAECVKDCQVSGYQYCKCDPI